jgi:tetratricopeptide (TPR) repeat protein
VEDAEDESLPLAARMNTVLMLGGMDQSHRRYDAALKKYDLVLRYAINANVPQLACAALNQMGESFRDRGEKERAALFFGAALESGGAIGPVAAGPALLNAMINAANLAQEAQRWPDAETFFQGATLLAGLQSDPRLRLHCIDRRGVALYKQNKADEALAAWTEMEKSAKGGGQMDMQLLALQRFREHYLLTNHRVGLVEMDRRIAELRAQSNQPA